MESVESLLEFLEFRVRVLKMVFFWVCFFHTMDVQSLNELINGTALNAFLMIFS